MRYIVDALEAALSQHQLTNIVQSYLHGLLATNDATRQSEVRDGAAGNCVRGPELRN